MSDVVIVFKEWLPDLPDYNNPGMIEALNMVPVSGTYEDFKTFATVPSASFSDTGIVTGAFWAYNDGTGDYDKPYSASYATASASCVLKISGVTKSSAYTTNGLWQFSQSDDQVIAVTPLVRPQSSTIGAAPSNFATLASTGEAPFASVVGKIGQFVVLGQVRQTTTALFDPTVRWSAISNIRAWETPGSSTAIAQQSGEQQMDLEYGPVTGVAGADRWGVVFQERALTRMTYIGGNAVFQFDRYSEGTGCIATRSIIKDRGLMYFAGSGGIYVTDGASVRSISAGKIDRWLRDQNFTDFVTASYISATINRRKRLIYWGFGGSVTVRNAVVIYHIDEARWSHGSINHVQLLEKPWLRSVEDEKYADGCLIGTTGAFGNFLGAPGTATAITSERDINLGGSGIVDGVRVLTDCASIAVQIGTRATLAGSVTYGAAASANALSGFANFRQEDRYHRAKATLVGTFNSAQGCLVRFTKSGNQ